MEVKTLSFEDIQELKKVCIQFLDSSKVQETLNAYNNFNEAINPFTVLCLIQSYEDMREAFFREMYD